MAVSDSIARPSDDRASDPGGRVRIVDRLPEAEEITALRRAVGWPTYPLDAVREGAARALFGVCAEVDGTLVGAVRIFGDGRTCFYIHEVVVLPECQGQGVGRRLMERVMGYIADNACSIALVALISTAGREGFYERFGFRPRPSEAFGSGMVLIWPG